MRVPITRLKISTILHLAASKSDPETLVLLKRARPRGVDVEAKNEDGFTAQQLATEKHRNNRILQTRFKALMRNLAALAHDLEEVESLTSATSGEESWKSFGDAVWDEAEKAAE